MKKQLATIQSLLRRLLLDNNKDLVISCILQSPSKEYKLAIRYLLKGSDVYYSFQLPEWS
jgi:hypothetical protein